MEHNIGTVSFDTMAQVNTPLEKPKTYISIDLETTGLVMEKHGIIQIGAWATGESEDHFKDYFVMDVNPHERDVDEPWQRVAISPEALKVNGFTEERIENGTAIWQALLAFNNWLRKWETDTTTICIGQNVAFDIAWLKRDFYRQGLDTGIFRRVADCYTLSLLAFGIPLGLGKVASRLGLKYPAHDALADAYTASRVFHRLHSFLAKDYPSVKAAEELLQSVPPVYDGGTASPCVR